MIEPKRELARFLSLLMVAGLVLWGGCSSSDDDADDMNQGEASVPSETGNDVMVADHDETPAPQDAEQERAAAIVQSLLVQADELAAAGQLDAAKDRVMQALQIDPNSAAAQARLAAITEKMGNASSPQDLAQQVVEYKEAMRQKRVIEVRDAYNDAQKKFGYGDYKDAKERLEYADLIIKYDGLQTDFGSLPSDVTSFLAEVENRIRNESAIREEQQYQDTIARIREEEEKERGRRAEQIQLLMTQGVEAFARQDFSTSEALAKEVLAIAPSFRKAEDLLQASRAAKDSQWRERLYKQRSEQFTQWLENVRAAQIPWTQLLQFPDRAVWDQLTARRRASENSKTQAEDSERVQAIKNQLEATRVNWKFDGITLREALQQIRDTQQLNVLMTQAAQTDKGEETVDFTVRDMKFSSALRNLLEPLELTYIFKFDLLYIAKKDEPLGAPIPKVYEVRDLTIALTNFVAPNLQIRPGPAGEASTSKVWGSESDEQTVDLSPDQMLDLIKTNVEPTSWDVEGHSLELSANQLVAVTTPEVHAKVDSFLEDLRRYTKLIVHVESRFISIRKGFLSEFGIEFRGLGGANPGTLATLDDVQNGNDDNASAGVDNNGVGVPAASSLSPTSGLFFNDNNEFDYRGRTENIFDRALGNFLSETGGATIGITILDDLELGLLIRAVEKSLFANVMTAPRLTVYNNQRANLSIINQVSYIKDYDVEVAQTAFIADPLVDIVQDGLVLDVKPVVSHDRRYVTLDVQPTVATLNRPIQTFQTPLAGLTTSVIIELPEIQYRSAQTTVKVPDNGTLVIGGLKDVSTVDRRSETPILSQIPILSFFFSKKGRSDEISDLMVLLRVKILDMTEEEGYRTN